MGKKRTQSKGKRTVIAPGEHQDAIPDLVFHLGQDLQVIGYNQPVASLLEKPDPAAILETCNQLVRELKVAIPDSSLAKIRQEEDPYIRELSFLGKKYQVTLTPMKDAEGAFEGCVCHARLLDPATRVNGRENEIPAEFQALIANIDDRIWAVDRNYCLTYANPAMQKSLHKRIGKDIQIGESFFWEGIDPKLVASWKASYDRALAGETFLVEANTLFMTETAYISCEFKPVRKVDGEVIGVMVHGRDITKYIHAEEILRESEAKYRQLFEAESDSIFLIDNESGSILEANTAAERLYGYDRNELLSMKNTDLSAEPDQTEDTTRNTPLDPEAIVNIPTRFHRKKDGTVFPVEITGRFFQWRGRPVHIAAIRDITERKQAQEAMVRVQIQMRQSMQQNRLLQERLQEQAIRDPLTNLYNRRYMEDTLVREIAQAIRDRHPIGIIMIDIDNFKAFNDSHGHQSGDQALERIGALLNSVVRSGDIACRYGGEEFVIIMPMASFENTIKRGKEIKVRFESLPIPVEDDQQDYLTISVGISSYPLHGSDRDTILNNADKALYKAKSLGKNCVVAYEEDDGPRVE